MIREGIINWITVKYVHIKWRLHIVHRAIMCCYDFFDKIYILFTDAFQIVIWFLAQYCTSTTKNLGQKYDFKRNDSFMPFVICLNLSRSVWGWSNKNLSTNRLFIRGCCWTPLPLCPPTLVYVFHPIYTITKNATTKNRHKQRCPIHRFSIFLSVIS